MSWFVVATKPNAERLACTHLERQGFMPYLPQLKVQRRHARRVEMVNRPLFPRYVFVELDLRVAHWHAINGTYGVQHILTHDGRPHALQDGFVDALMAREQDGFEDLSQQLQPGDMAQVCGGPFDEQIGKILSADQAGRVRLLMNLMGGEVVSTVAADRLLKVG